MSFKQRSYEKRVKKYGEQIKTRFDEIMVIAEEHDRKECFEISNILIKSDLIFALLPMLSNEGIECQYKGDLEEKGQSAFKLSWM